MCWKKISISHLYEKFQPVNNVVSDKHTYLIYLETLHYRTVGTKNEINLSNSMLCVHNFPLYQLNHTLPYLVL